MRKSFVKCISPVHLLAGLLLFFGATDLLGAGQAGSPNSCEDMDLTSRGDELARFLEQKIKDSGLDEYYPPEYEDCANKDRTKMWVEHIRGVIKFESDGKACSPPSDGAMRSSGLLQMSKGDKCGGRPLLQTDNDPFDSRKNIECGVWTWKACMEGSCAGNASPGRGEGGESAASPFRNVPNRRIASANGFQPTGTAPSRSPSFNSGSTH